MVPNAMPALTDLLVSGRLPHAEKNKEKYRAEMDAIGSMYGPVEVEVELDRGGRRSALVYALKRIPRFAKPVESGDWIAHCRARAAPHRP